MGYLEVSGVGYRLPDGRPLLHDVNFRVGEGTKTALIGANGCGKTTLLRLLAGDLPLDQGTVARDGQLGVMRQFIGTGQGVTTVHDLLLSVAPQRVRAAAQSLDRTELAMMDNDDAPAQFAYAAALTDWADAGGYESETLWDKCCSASLAQSYDSVRWRDVTTLSGGEQKRLVLQALLRGPDQVLILDEPDNYLDVPSKEWLEHSLIESPKTVLFVSHDRELLARTAQRIVTLEGSSDGNAAWVHGGGFSSHHATRLDRHARFAERQRRWGEERAKLQALVKALQLAKSSKTQAAVSRLERHATTEPPEPPHQQQITMRLGGGRTGIRAMTCTNLSLTSMTAAFNLEVFYGERVAILGNNGTGKSHFLRLLGGWPSVDAVAHEGHWKLGARVVPGHFSQTHDHPELTGRTLQTILWEDHSVQVDHAVAALRRYELTGARDQAFDTLSGGQQARFQILLLELSGTTMLLLDEPTDNLDVESAEALESAIEEFDGTVLIVTHDRWLARTFDRFINFSSDGRVTETSGPVWAD